MSGAFYCVFNRIVDIMYNYVVITSNTIKGEAHVQSKQGN
jgi:hypothetical protein